MDEELGIGKVLRLRLQDVKFSKSAKSALHGAPAGGPHWRLTWPDWIRRTATGVRLKLANSCIILAIVDHGMPARAKVRAMDTLLLAELQSLIARHCRADATPFRPLPHVTLMSASSATPPIAEISEPMFALVARGAKHLCLGDRIFGYSTGQYLIVSVDLPLQAHVSEATLEAPFLGLGFTLRAEAIASLLLETGTAQSTISDTLGIAVSNLTDDLIDPLVRLLRLMDRPADIRHFQTVTSMTPIRYQKQICLQTARTLLMSEAEDVSRSVSPWVTKARRNSVVNIAGSSAKRRAETERGCAR